MVNIFYNKTELRIRAGWRILFQFVLMVILMVIFSIPDITWGGDTLRMTLNGLAMLVSVYISGLFYDRRLFRDFGLHFNAYWWKCYGAGTMAGVMAILFIFVSCLAFGWISITGFGWDRTPTDKFLPSILLYLYMMLWVGFYEEVFSRGYQMKNMVEGFTTGKNKQTFWPAAWAILVSSVVFSMMHAFNPGFNYMSLIGIVMAGVILAVPYLVTGNLGFSVGLHFAWNFFLGGVAGFPVSGNPFRHSLFQLKITGPEWITGGPFGPEAGFIGFIALAGIFYGVWIWLRKSRTSFNIHPSFFRITEPDSIDQKEA